MPLRQIISSPPAQASVSFRIFELLRPAVNGEGCDHEYFALSVMIIGTITGTNELIDERRLVMCY